LFSLIEIKIPYIIIMIWILIISKNVPSERISEKLYPKWVFPID